MTRHGLSAGLPALALAALIVPAQAQQAGDPVAGEKAFTPCKACHTVEAGKNRIGPSLHGVVGRKAGSAPGFTYSPAMANSGITWTPENIEKYLADPKAMVPGNKMAFPGLKNEQDRKNVIAYLESQAKK